MNWYKGNIALAVSLSKAKNAIFVVYVEGKDEATAALNGIINDTRIREKLESNDFVAIKIESESESYMQFASIFQVVPVPSIFFIGKTGTLLEIVAGALSSVEELEGKIDKVLQLEGKVTVPSTSTASAASDFIREESKASSSAGATAEAKEVNKGEPVDKNIVTNEKIVCKDGVCFKKSKEVEEVKFKKEKSQTTSHDEEVKFSEMQKNLEDKRRERIEEEKRLEKENELRRRKEGRDMQNLRNMQHDKELKELKENIKRERLEDQAARERIRAQIAADKAERAHKFATENQATTSSKAASNTNPIKPEKATAATHSDETRIQFRLASGVSNNHNFKCSTTLVEIRDYVALKLLPGTGIEEFTLSTSYPKLVLTSEYDSKTLLELNLFPSAVILIIGKISTGPTTIISRNGGLLNMVSVMIMSIINPICSIFTSAKDWLIKGKRNESSNDEQNQQNDVSRRRNLDRFLNSGTGNVSGTSNQSQGNVSPHLMQGGAYRRHVGGSNIHRLSDSCENSDDENATWNGNSTQQQ